MRAQENLEINEGRDFPSDFSSLEGSPSFEDAFSRLGETVRALESGGLTLEASTELYEEGMRLVQLCNKLLGTAEMKVTQLKDAYSDEPDPGPPEDEE